MKIAACTASGARPVQLGWCREMMQAQSRVPDMHIVSEDETLNIRDNLMKVLQEGLDQGADVLYIIEDDDWYPPNYIERHIKAFDAGWHLVGSSFTYYYNVPTKTYVQIQHANRSSGCATICSRYGAEQVIEALKRLVDGTSIIFSLHPMTPEHLEELRSVTVDLPIWFDLRSRLPSFLLQEPTMIGIKGLPGRTGLTQGHKRLPCSDPQGRVLTEWVGEEWASRYFKFCEQGS